MIQSRRSRRGYTAVEVLMSMAVLAVGVIGIIAGEKVTLASNQHAKNLAIATRIATSWVGMLDAEAALWSSNGALDRTVWLAEGLGTPRTWLRPTYNGGLAFGPAFDALGNPMDPDADPEAKFCADFRLSPLTTDNTGGGMVRVEVRVVWLRNEAVLGGLATAPSFACDIDAADVDGTDESRLFHFVYMSSAVRQVGT